MVLYIHDATVTCVNQTPLKVAMGFSCTVCTHLYVIHIYSTVGGSIHTLTHTLWKISLFVCTCQCLYVVNVDIR